MDEEIAQLGQDLSREGLEISRRRAIAIFDSLGGEQMVMTAVPLGVWVGRVDEERFFMPEMRHGVLQQAVEETDRDRSLTRCGAVV